MMRRIAIHVLLMFTLMFNIVAQAMPCCDMGEQDQGHAMHAMHESMGDMHMGMNMDHGDFMDHSQCASEGHACCYAASIPQKAAVILAQPQPLAYTDTFTTPRILAFTSTLDRPPRV